MGSGWIGAASVVAGLAAGACIIIQQALVAELRASLASPLWAVFVSYLGGLLVMVATVTLAREPWPSQAALAGIPWLTWAGGLFGAIYILTAIIILPRLGATATFALILAGQMAASLVIDHFGLLGLRAHPIDWTRLAGAILLGAGVLLVSR